MFLLPGEAVDSLAVIGLVCFDEGLLPFRMVNGIGIELSFQSNAGALAVDGAALAGLVQEVACIQLDAAPLVRMVFIRPS